MAMNSFKKLIMMANQIEDKPSLPSYFVRCEYLESTGTQYIDLGYPLGYENKVVIDVESNNTTTESILIGNNTISSRAFAIGTKNKISANFRFDGRTIQCNLYKEGRYFISMDKNSASAKEDVYTWNPASFVTEGNVFLFAWRGASGTAQYFYKGKVYSCQIYENDVLIHDYIPAFNVNLSRAGMYDLVTGIFLTNNGTGEFVFEMPNIPDIQKPYLCFEAVEDDFQAKYSINPCEYSIDNRKTWNELPADTLTPAISAGSKIYFRGKGLKNSGNSRGTFSMTKLFNISGNMLSMVHGSDFLTGTPDDYACAYMFRDNKKIVSISDDFFNIKNSFRAFQFIFDNSSLTNVNIYNVNNGLYMYAFRNSMLKKVTFFAKERCTVQCFSNSFYNTAIEELDITYNLIEYGALNSIAGSCKFLKKVIIRATSIFYVESLASYSNYFNSSFANCPLLNNVTFLVANIPLSKRISNNWLTGVAEEGTIILNKNITWNPDDYRNGNIDNIEGSATLGETITWGIPVGWEVKYCDPENLDDVRDYREIDKAWNE